MKSKAEIHCLGSDCPERFSLCCGAGSRSASEGEMMLGVPQFFCGKCGKKFKGGKCRSAKKMEKLSEMLANNYDWRKAFNEEFCIMAGNGKYRQSFGLHDQITDFELREFIEMVIEYENMKMLQSLRTN